MRGTGSVHPFRNCRLGADFHPCRLSEDDGDLANLIVNNLDSDPKTVAGTFCKPICSASGGKKEEL